MLSSATDDKIFKKVDKTKKFKLNASYSPKGDQEQAIEKLSEGIEKGLKHQTLLGATGTGKTFTMANIIANTQRPTLVIAPNKTLAAQLFEEFKRLFPENAVRYFVSYFDYYQPESYIPETDQYIEKATLRNEEIERYRNAATQSLLTQRDVIIVATVSCIYSLGDPQNYEALSFDVHIGAQGRNDILKYLVLNQYIRNDFELKPGCFRVKGDVIDIYPTYQDYIIRIELFDDEVERILEIEPITGEIINFINSVTIFPSKHYVTPTDILKERIPIIRQELEIRLKELESQGKLIEAQRLKQRVNYDIEMLEEVGYCNGIENYSRIIEGRRPGEPSWCLLDYFPKDYLIFIDESHITIPQIRGMFFGDRSRKKTLVEYGFRLPCALDNRPLNFKEFSQRANQTIYVSATPQEYELINSILEANRVFQQTDEEIIELVHQSMKSPKYQKYFSDYTIYDATDSFVKSTNNNTNPLTENQEILKLSDALLNYDVSSHEDLSEPDTFYKTEIDQNYDANKISEEVKNKLYSTIITRLGYQDYYKTGITQQIIRPTGLLDPLVEIRPTSGQIKDLIQEIEKRKAKNQRTLITTLTKRMAEELTDYLQNHGIKVQYLHSDIETIERLEILKDLRLGVFDVVVGINLLREGLDLPEVSLVIILDADKEGFLRNQTSLIQTIGRAARNVEGHVIMYADNVTDSMKLAIEETNRRRRIQLEHNQKYNITPTQIIKPIDIELVANRASKTNPTSSKNQPQDKTKYKIKAIDEINKEVSKLSNEEIEKLIIEYETKMKKAAEILEFHLAAEYRDHMLALQEILAMRINNNANKAVSNSNKN